MIYLVILKKCGKPFLHQILDIRDLDGMLIESLFTFSLIDAAAALQTDIKTGKLTSRSNHFLNVITS